MLLVALMALADTATAQGTSGGGVQTWPEKKCAFYAKAWRELLEMSGRKGITEGFIAGNEAFVAAGCSNGADVCPSSREDIALANNLTMAAMNFGTASSFLPFVCRQRPPTAPKAGG